MIPYNNATKQDFVPIELMQQIESFITTTDCVYVICEGSEGEYYITTAYEALKDSILYGSKPPVCATYTLSELLYKLHEWHPKYKGISIRKDAQFYFAQYEDAPDNSPFSCYSEYPIIAAAQLLINCLKENFGCVDNILNKRKDESYKP